MARGRQETLAFSEDAIKFLKQLPTLSDEARIDTYQLALLRNVSKKMIEEERARGDGIPFEKHGRVVRYRLGTVREYLAKLEQKHS